MLRLWYAACFYRFILLSSGLNLNITFSVKIMYTGFIICLIHFVMYLSVFRLNRKELRRSFSLMNDVLSMRITKHTWSRRTVIIFNAFCLRLFLYLTSCFVSHVVDKIVVSTHGISIFYWSINEVYLTFIRQVLTFFRFIYVIFFVNDLHIHIILDIYTYMVFHYPITYHQSDLMMLYWFIFLV